jgi:hypothetical protein
MKLKRPAHFTAGLFVKIHSNILVDHEVTIKTLK